MKTRKQSSSLYIQLALFALIMTFIGLRSNYDSVKWLFTNAGNFRTTKGIITSSDAKYSGLRGGWKIDIEYEYSIYHVTYISNRIHYGYQASDDKSFAQGYVEKYPVGKEVLVYYNPDKRSQSVLEPEVKWVGQVYVYAFGVFFSLLFLSLAVREKKARTVKSDISHSPHCF